MPKCLECGYESSRLQWTHFRYKCTGRFANGEQYMRAYPGSKVVDDELAKRTAVTLHGLIKKYGEHEGLSKWDQYREKQAYSNSLEFKKEKHGWSEDQFKQYNKGRATTVDNLVSRYGLEAGLERWQDYCEKQKVTKSREYVVEKYGESHWINLCNRKAHTVENTANRHGLTYEEAADKLASRYRLGYCSGLEIEFVDALEKIVGKLDHTSLDKPYGKWNHDTNGYVVYDIKHKDCIIEFNGDYWHANPTIYQASDMIRNTSAEQIWLNDKQKLDIARQHGFRVLVVWEYDYRFDKNKVIKETAEWMLNTQQ